MRSFALAAVTAAVFLPGSVLAADFGQRFGHPYGPVAAMPGWTGFYLGANLGGGIGSSQTTFSVPGVVAVSAPNLSMSGVLGGVQGGFNWQTGPFVLGVETDFQGTSLSSSLQTPCVVNVCTVSAQHKHSVSWFGTVRGRVGYAFDRTLVYATGGYAYANVKTDSRATDGLVMARVDRSQIVGGWTAGGGAEVMFTPNWSVKAEYLYVSLDETRGTLGPVGGFAVNHRSRIDMNVLRAGVNYRF